VKRREFITLLGGATVAWPLGADGQEFGRIYRVGALIVSPRDAPHHVAFFDELRRLGFIDGQNLAVDVGGYGLSIERLAGHAADLAKGPVDVILATGDEAVLATFCCDASNRSVLEA
jgi:putative tryptophan/tyrosine transport system substrate-binding protein